MRLLTAKYSLTNKNFKMSYSTTYGTCDDALDPHVSEDCDVAGEKARIRRGAFIHKSVIDAINADPTDVAAWNAAITDNKVILLPKLSGTFDGGTPKMVAGFGDQKEKYSGSDFKANIKDPVYKSNWAFYRSLAGNTSWHFAYWTESQVHITDVPVTVAPKNPVTENVDDDVLWEAELSWFQFFTPAPHDGPAVF